MKAVVLWWSGEEGVLMSKDNSYIQVHVSQFPQVRNQASFKLSEGLIVKGRLSPCKRYYSWYLPGEAAQNIKVEASENPPELVDLVYSYFCNSLTRHKIPGWPDCFLCVLREPDFPVIKVMSGTGTINYGDPLENFYERLSQEPNLREKFYAKFKKTYQYLLKYEDHTLKRYSTALCEAAARDKCLNCSEPGIKDIRLIKVS